MLFNLLGFQKESPALLHKFLDRNILQHSAFEVEPDLHVEVRTRAEAYEERIRGHFRKIR